MTRLPYAIFAALLGGAAILQLATTGALPDRIPTHFGASGVPNAWMTRGGYTTFMLAFTVGLPILVVAAIGVLPRLAPRLVNLPNRDHWLAPGRREASLAYLGRHACWLGCMMVLMGAGAHVLIVRASSSSPPRLEQGLFLGLLSVFLGAMVVWIVALVRRFPRPRQTGRFR
jgi:uncharacterized membrane protein